MKSSLAGRQQRHKSASVALLSAIVLGLGSVSSMVAAVKAETTAETPIAVTDKATNPTPTTETPAATDQISTTPTTPEPTTPAATDTTAAKGDTNTTTPAATATTPTPSATPATSAAEKTAADTKATTTDPDDTPVVFADSNLATTVATAFGVTPATLTPNVVKKFAGEININQTTPVTSLQGLEVLQQLAKTVPIITTIELSIPAQAGSSFDFTPLLNIHFGQLSLKTPNWGMINDQSLSQLLQLDSSSIFYLELDGGPDNLYYQQNVNGLTNRQLALLGPLMVAVGNNGVSQPLKEISLSNNCLTDFSPLMGITQPISIVAFG